MMRRVLWLLASFCRPSLCRQGTKVSKSTEATRLGAATRRGRSDAPERHREPRPVENEGERERTLTTVTLLSPSDAAVPPAAVWVRFLRSYGPTPQNLTLFDEYVSGAVGRANVQPIQLATPLLEDMVKHIESKAPGSMLIAGTAGDGKTYHCRVLWARLGGDP